MNEDSNIIYPQPHCPNCNSPLRLIPEKNDWFCDKCNIFPKTSKELDSNINKGSVKGNQKFWIISGIILALVFIWFIYESNSTNDPFLQSFYFYGAFIVVIAYFVGLFITKMVLNRK